MMLNSTIQARQGLALVASGEESTIEGWLMYGEALNVGRAMFPQGDNKRFSEWVATAKLAIVLVLGNLAITVQ